MKELSIEQKAKRYDEAIEKAKTLYENANGMILLKKWVEQVFPELKESEDERIRKALYLFVEAYGEHANYEVTKEEMLAWLEKQGEHANFRNKIQIGDKVTRNVDGILVNISQLNRVAKKREKQGEQKPTDEIGNYDHGKVLDALMSAKKTPEPAWSEEDETIINKILFICDYYVRSFQIKDVYIKIIKKDVSDIENWLKSLRPQSTWKPSVEQMNALDSTLQYSQVSHNSFEHLNSLFNDLKKLREE